MIEHYPIVVIVAAASGLLASAITGWWAAYRADSARRRERFADALTAVTEYCEFPYVIRRRGSGDPEAERLRISTELRSVQQHIAFHQGWLRTEADDVADAYDRLVAEMRQVVGCQMHEAWTLEPIATDAEMNISGIKRGDFDALRDAYLSEAKGRCSWHGVLRRLWVRSR